MDLRRRDLQEGGLAGPVGSEHHPAFVLLDGPVDLVDEVRLSASHRHARQLENGVHVLQGLLVGRRLASGTTYTDAYPRRVSAEHLPLSARFALWFSAWV